MEIPQENLTTAIFNEELGALETKQSDFYLNMLEVFGTQKDIDMQFDEITEVVREINEKKREQANTESVIDSDMNEDYNVDSTQQFYTDLDQLSLILPKLCEA